MSFQSQKKIIDFELLCNTNNIKFKKNKSNQPSLSSLSTIHLYADDNHEIIDLLQNRLKLGYSRYNHGVRINEDTRVHGTISNDWEEMFMEEALDGMIYIAAAMIRFKRAKKYGYNNNVTNDDSIINESKKCYIRSR